MQGFPKDATVKFTATFLQGGALVDPTTVTADTFDGSATSVNYTISDPELTKLSTGIYELEVPLDIAGLFTVRFTGAGGGYDGVQELRVLVEDSDF